MPAVWQLPVQFRKKQNSSNEKRAPKNIKEEEKDARTTSSDLVVM